MRVARKLALGLVAGVLAVMAGYAWVQVSREVEILDANLVKNEKFGRGIAAALESIWATDGEARAREVLATIDRNGPDVIQLRWRSLSELRADPPEGVSPEDLGDPDEAERRHGATDDGGEWVRHIRHARDPRSRARRRRGARVVAGRAPLHRPESPRARARDLLVALICGLTAVGLGYWFVGRPLARLRDQARAIGAGALAERVDVRQHDEIGDLATELNRMGERLAEARTRLANETEARSRRWSSSGTPIA
jgi:methyl-accepting chemotaxis protein